MRQPSPSGDPRGAVVDDGLIVTITLDPDSHTCEGCGRTIVPCDDRGPAPADSHTCPSSAAAVGLVR